MKGVVEIYRVGDGGEEELIYQDDNMTTVGFAEQIVDLMTTPSGVENPTSLNSAILDSSNYTIQGVAFGKHPDHFTQRGHQFDTSNL